MRATPKPTPSDSIPEGKVIGTDPPAGTMLPRDTEVTLLISTGPALVDVPDVRGRTRAEAESILTGAGLSVRVSFRIVPAPQKGIVLDQVPGERSDVPPLSFVNITVGI